MTNKWYQNVTQNNQRLLDWSKKTRDERRANILFPHLASKDDQQAMKSLAAGEGRKAPHQNKLLSNQERAFVSPLGGTARSSK
jgi:hypothetical protein